MGSTTAVAAATGYSESGRRQSVCHRYVGHSRHGKQQLPTRSAARLQTGVNFQEEIQENMLRTMRKVSRLWTREQLRARSRSERPRHMPVER